MIVSAHNFKTELQDVMVQEIKIAIENLHCKQYNKANL